MHRSVLARWDEKCLPLGLRMEKGMETVHLSTKEGMVRFLKFLLDACEDPKSVGGGKDKTRERAAIAGFIMWTLAIYGRRFLYNHSTFFKTVFLKLVELREDVKRLEGFEHHLLEEGTAMLLLFKSTRKPPVSQKVYVTLLPLLHQCLAKEKIEKISRVLERAKAVCNLKPEAIDDEEEEEDEDEEDEPPVSSHEPSLSSDEKHQDVEEEIVEKTSSYGGFLSWFW